MKFLPLIFCFLIISCTTVRDSSPKHESFVGVKDGNLIYEGKITEASNDAIFVSFRDAKLKPNRLLISSNGGEIGAGMDLAHWVKENSLDVEVIDVCASSCANYVFPAGNTKYLRKDSVLMWHGSAWQSSWDSEKNIALMRKKETNFFVDIETDNLLCTYGQSKINFWDYLPKLFGRGIIGYDYSLADMKKFGLSNIVLIDGEWNWRKYRANKAHLVKRVEVDSDFEFKLRRFEM